jgi:hypothetical protein
MILPVLMLASLASAQYGSNYERDVAPATPAPGGPVQNLNATGNPTAAAIQPPTYTGNPEVPTATYPAADTNPAWRGGSKGQDPSKEDDGPGIEARERDRFNRQRKAAEPDSNTHTATPPGDLASPSPEPMPEPQPEPNPGAVQGGPQP